MYWRLYDVYVYVCNLNNSVALMLRHSVILYKVIHSYNA